MGTPDTWLVVVSGWTGAGKSTIADRLGDELGATVASFDWLMSGLRAVPDVWDQVEGRRRDIPGWYELDWVRVLRGREAYRPLDGPKVVVDAADRLDDNVSLALAHLAGLRLPRPD